MDKPQAVRMGKPYCHSQLLYLIYKNGGVMKCVELRNALAEDGYNKYCIYGIQNAAYRCDRNIRHLCNRFQAGSVPQ